MWPLFRSLARSIIGLKKKKKSSYLHHLHLDLFSKASEEKPVPPRSLVRNLTVRFKNQRTFVIWSWTFLSHVRNTKIIYFVNGKALSHNDLLLHLLPNESNSILWLIRMQTKNTNYQHVLFLRVSQYLQRNLCMIANQHRIWKRQ